MTAALPAFLDGQHLVETFGVVGLLLIVFAETGLLLGFFLPGDSLLFAAGVASAGGIPHVHPPIGWLCVGLSLVAIAGAQTGYLLGRTAGATLFERGESRLFKRSYITKTEEALEKYGVGKALVLARFVPIVRTFLSPLVGAAGLPMRVFTLWNVVGGVLWGTGVTLLGYALGRSVVGKNLELLALVVVAISVLPLALELRRSRRTRSS